MNNDLISRSAAIKEFEDILLVCAAKDEDIVEYLRDRIEIIAAVDAEVVRHGRWLNKTERIYADLNYRFDCSVCSHIFYAAGIETFNYCPNCGAKMDAEVEG